MKEYRLKNLMVHHLITEYLNKLNNLDELSRQQTIAATLDIEGSRRSDYSTV